MNKQTRREREQQERQEIILTKAEELFCRYGFEKASMDDLAREAEFTKRTIYRYFTCKEDLYYAVALRGNERLFELVTSESSKGATGFDRIRSACYAYYRFFRENPKRMQLITTGELIKTEAPEAEMPYRQRFLASDQRLFGALLRLFYDGKADGSLRADVDIAQLAVSTIFTATGFFQMLSLSGSSYAAHFSLDEEGFITFTLERLLDTLRSR